MSILLLTAITAVAAGCSSAAVERDGPSITLPHLSRTPPAQPTSSTSPASTTRPGTPGPTTHDEAGAANAWVQSMDAFYEAALADEPEDPAFLRTLVPGGPVYTHSIGWLTGIAAGGAVGPATWRVGNAVVVAASSTRATVTGCAFDTGSRMRGSSSPAPASLGGGAGYTATRAFLVWRAGRWVVLAASTSQVTPSEGGPCQGY